MLITNIDCWASVSLKWDPEICNNNTHLWQKGLNIGNPGITCLKSWHRLSEMPLKPLSCKCYVFIFQWIRINMPKAKKSGKQRISKSLEQTQNKQMWIPKVTFRHCEMESPYSADRMWQCLVNWFKPLRPLLGAGDYWYLADLTAVALPNCSPFS